MNNFSGDTERYLFNLTGDVLVTRWDDNLSVLTPEFLESVKKLVGLLTEKSIPKLLIDSGIPEGGVLTEEVITYLIENAAQTQVRYIAILESVDFHWDNNMGQLFNYLQSIVPFSFEVRFFRNSTEALDWLFQPEILLSLN
jgi:hypothetical protein